MKVAFYIDNSRHKGVDFSNVEAANPGVGGTEYLFYSTCYAILKSDKSGIDVCLLTYENAILPADMRSESVGSKKRAFDFCKDNGYDILIVKYEEKDYDIDDYLFYDKRENHLKVIVWAHNVIPNHILSRMNKIGGISAIVNVGREQLDLYRDHQMFNRSCFIYNSLPIKPYAHYIDNSLPFAQRCHEVTYLGSLVPVKGFHILAKIWKRIISEVPDAHLNVIGSGNLYDTSQRLGKYGIAEESYENQFMPYLTDNNGVLLKSVKFWGKLGAEKDEILSRTRVGVPNPSGTSETFCLSALEMALWGARIVSHRYVGLIDTVTPIIGQLVKNEDQLANSIIAELKKEDISNNDKKAAYDFIERNFSMNVIIEQWISLFETLNTEGQIKPDSTKVNMGYNLKWLRECNRIIKKVLPFGKYLPTIDIMSSIISRLTHTNFYNIKY